MASGYTTGQLVAAARAAAERWHVPPDVYVRQINQESGFNPDAHSPAGAAGIAQFMPATAKGFGLADPYEPISALDAGAHYLSNALQKYGSLPLALAAYNAGGGAVEKYGGVPPYRETQAYVRAILGGGTPQIADRSFAAHPVALAAGIPTGFPQGSPSPLAARLAAMISNTNHSLGLGGSNVLQGLLAQRLSA